MNELVFGRSELWPFVLLLPVVALLLHAVLRRTAARARVYGAGSRDRVPSPAARTVRMALIFGLGFCCWLDPRWGEETVAFERRGLDVIFCLDTSRSMLAADLEPSRLQRAKQDVRATLDEMQGGDRAALVVFAGQARVWTPLTHDLVSFGRLLDEVTTAAVPIGGTDIAAALRHAGELALAEAEATTAVVLLTDGEDLAGAGRQAAAELGERGIVVHAVGYGSTLGHKIAIGSDGKEEFLRDRSGEEVVSRLDATGLREIVAAGGGDYVRADAMELPVRELYRKRLQPMEKRAFEQGEDTMREPRYQWVLLPLLLLLGFDLVTNGGRRR